jgi:uncharacterized membrane protein YciS (DUF1049 family)
MGNNEVRLLKKTLLLMLFLVFLFFGIWLAKDNPAVVTVALLGFPVSGLSLGLWLLLMLFAGIMLGLIVTAPVTARLAARIRRLERKLVESEKEIARVKAGEQGRHKLPDVSN